MYNEYFEDQISNDRGIFYTNRGYMIARKENLDRIIIDNIPFGSRLTDDVRDITEELTKAGITDVVIQDASAALMEFLFEMDKFGWRISGLYKNHPEQGKARDGICLKNSLRPLTQQEPRNTVQK